MFIAKTFGVLEESFDLRQNIGLVSFKRSFSLEIVFLVNYKTLLKNRQLHILPIFKEYVPVNQKSKNKTHWLKEKSRAI